MKIHVVASARSGGTAYAHYLSEIHNLPFINEPFQEQFIENKVNFKDTDLGGGISVNEYVAHSIINQYIDYKHKCNGEKIILIERKDKWKQLVSFIVMWEMLKIYGIHNYNFISPHTITADLNRVKFMLYQWYIFDKFKSELNYDEFLYYEDLEIKSSKFVKNLGYNNVVISNLASVRNHYNNYLINKDIFGDYNASFNS